MPFANNWADEISREGAQGTWAPRNAFLVKECGVVVELLRLPRLIHMGGSPQESKHFPLVNFLG